MNWVMIGWIFCGNSFHNLTSGKFSDASNHGYYGFYQNLSGTNDITEPLNSNGNLNNTMKTPFFPPLLITAAIIANATVASAESGSRQADSELAGSKPEGGPPNIIVIMPDDSSYGNYSCLGNPIIKTPNIDDLKKQSLLLTQYHSSARCSPSRAKLLSGRHEFLGGVTHTIQGRERLSLDTITLPQALKTAGYATGFFGKWHNGKKGPYRPENRGFDECWMYEKGSRMKATISHNGKPQRMDGTYPTDLFF